MTVHVDLGARSYPIVIDAGALRRAGRLLTERIAGRHAWAVTHPALARFYVDDVRKSLSEAGFRFEVATIPPGERQKSMRRLTDLLGRMLAAGLDRRSVLVALGGGVIGDLAGLAAAIYMRGISYVQVPTTLLAMVDSSVGGKTAIDFGDAKNAVGAFHQPSLVVIDPNVLRTLPRREIRSGLAEVIKYGVLGDAAFFAWVREHAASLVALEPDVIATAIGRSCEMKAERVHRDERDETGLRAALNLGHTYGHALESHGGYRLYRHGEAVAIGMVAEARLSERIGVAQEAIAAPLIDALERLGLPTGPRRPVDVAWLLQAMMKDKKTTAGQLNFALPRRIGEVELVPVDCETARRTLEAIWPTGATAATSHPTRVRAGRRGEPHEPCA